MSIVLYFYIFFHHIICLPYCLCLNWLCLTNCLGKIINENKFSWHLNFSQIKKSAVEGHENAFKMVMYQNRGYVNAKRKETNESVINKCVDPQFCPSTLAFIIWVSHSPIVLI